MEENKESLKDVDFWATNSEEGGWNISSTDEAVSYTHLTLPTKA